MKVLFLRLSLITLIIGLIFGGLTLYMFHFLDEKGKPTLTYRKQAQKPFVTLMTGIFATLTLFTSMLSLIVALVFFA